MTDSEYLSGGNIAFRRALLASVGGFDETLGMLGSRLRYGEETAILHKLWRRNPGLIVYYSPAMAVQHLVRPEKMRLLWAMRTAFADGRDSYWVFAGEAYPEGGWRTWFVSAGQSLWRLAGDLGRGAFSRDRARYPYLENFVYEVIGRDVRRVGSLSAAGRRLAASRVLEREDD